MYKIRIILDTKEDVIRTIAVNNAINLEELHIEIAKSFGFNGQEMASFYRTDHEWNQGEEIPLFNMSEFGDANHKLIYVYDFMHMWSFYVELIAISDEILTEPSKVILSVGEIPENAPEKEFVAEKTDEDGFDDEFSDDEFDPYDENSFNY